MPKVSVCIPTYNRVNLLSQAIESVLNQTEQNFELIICDDGSIDNTPDLIQKYKSPKIKYIRHKQNIGKSNNMRSGFELATGEYFIKFDDDDQLTPTFLERTTVILDQNPTIDFVGTDHWIINIQGIRDVEATTLNSERWGRKNLSQGIVKNLLESVFVQQIFQIGATLFRRETLQEIDFLLPNIQNCEDNELFVRLAMAGKKGYYLPELLMEYRLHNEQEGLDRAIRYLQDKLSYLKSFEFEEEQIETIRKTRIAENELILGLRLIEKGKSEEGRSLLINSSYLSSNRPKVIMGKILSYLPLNIRKLILHYYRTMTPQDYQSKVRQSN